MSGQGVSAGLLTRIAVLVVIVVFFQIGVVSEVPVFGVVVDLSPLVVAFVGLLCGSTVGAATGFAVGLLVDLALVQTLGVTSLIFTLVGYWCGRLRELRDPQATLTPLLVGAAASAAATVGYSLMEFLLGVDAPVSLRAAAPDRAGGGGEHDRRAADVGDRAPQPRAGPAGRPPPAPSPRLHHGWVEPTLPHMSTPLERAGSGDPRTPPVSPQLALRVAVLGGAALLMFAIIFFRLWFLQVLSGEQYVQQANANDVRPLPIAAPRGQILDREGQPIVTSKVTNAVQIVPSALPPAGKPRIVLYHRLGALLGMSGAHIQALVERGRKAVPYAPVTIKTAAGRGVRTVLAERQNEYPGVVQEPVSIRSYPYGEMAAQVLGYVGQVSVGELKKPAFKGVEQGTVVGQEGLEYYYDHYLRGQPGVRRVEVNAAGYPEPSNLKTTQPQAGHSLQVTLDLPLEQEGEKALREGIEHARAAGKPAIAGAFVAIEPRTGEILATGSNPSFNPNKLAKPLTEREYSELKGSGSAPGPLTDRAVNGTYPTGSTFKPITAMAALEAGVMTPTEGLGAGQCIEVSGKEFCNAEDADYGAVGLVEALKVSSDTYFFTVGERSFSHGNIIQNMAHKLGVGEETGIDLPSEIEGLVPDAKWREEVNKEEESCQRKHHGASCGIVDRNPPLEHRRRDGSRTRSGRTGDRRRYRWRSPTRRSRTPT